MEVIIPCVACAEAAEPENGFGPDGVVIPMTTVLVQDDNLYRAACPEGHSLVVILDNLPFELLFQSGLEALVDGYLRESVSSFAAALERLYEFSIRVQMTTEGMASEKLDAMWKLVNSQSERQLGMYIGLRTLKEGKVPDVLPPDEVTFRNNVIHKGKFPTVEQAYRFGAIIYGLIVDEVSRLDKFHPESVSAQTFLRRESALKSLKGGEKPQFFTLGLAVAVRGHRPFSEVFINAKNSMRRRRAGEAPPASSSPLN